MANESSNYDEDRTNNEDEVKESEETTASSEQMQNGGQEHAARDNESYDFDLRSITNPNLHRISLIPLFKEDSYCYGPEFLEISDDTLWELASELEENGLHPFFETPGGHEKTKKAKPAATASTASQHPSLYEIPWELFEQEEPTIKTNTRSFACPMPLCRSFVNSKDACVNHQRNDHPEHDIFLANADEGADIRAC